MARIFIIVLLFLFFSFNHYTLAQHSSHEHASVYFNNKSTHHINSSGTHRSNYTDNVERDSNGRIKRSSKATYEFKKETGYPHGRKGYVIDHVVPLSKGGCDCPSNMQWQTIEEGKQKDKTERK